MLNDIYNRYQKKIFYGNHLVVKIQQFQRGTELFWITEAVNIKNKKQKILFKSRNVILATGAKQAIPSSFKETYNLKDTCQVFTSDQILKNNGFDEVVKLIKRKRGKCKISILGGSHSAFSIVYLLLNGACKINCFEDILRKQRQVRKANSSSMVKSK